MPIKHVPLKAKIAVYLTRVEQMEVDLASKARGMSVSEYVRQCVLTVIAPRPANDMLPSATSPPTANNSRLPNAQELLKDFQFGDINESTDESEQ